MNIGAQTKVSQHTLELSRGERFAFGDNWSRYLRELTPERIDSAVASMRELLEIDNLAGKRFLDIGSGSGLFSLAARMLGASVHSFDYDPASVKCTKQLREVELPDDNLWTVDEGSILDSAYVGQLGAFDVVYSWGVLHHTGAMWQALENAASLVGERGQLAIAIYNDQGRASARWRVVKKAYCAAPEPVRSTILLGAFFRLWAPTMMRDLLSGKPGVTWNRYRRDHERGMSPWRDVVDWVGGYPFEVAKPEEVFAFLRRKGFALSHLKTCGGGLGCNEYVFKRT